MPNATILTVTSFCFCFTHLPNLIDIVRKIFSHAFFSIVQKTGLVISSPAGFGMGPLFLHIIYSHAYSPKPQSKVVETECFCFFIAATRESVKYQNSLTLDTTIPRNAHFGKLQNEGYGICQKI